ncbi:MAG TPA: hypothetical protein VNE16_12720 [Vicinamibacterales bacterium]|nr:hypothetical protein [Vicinamibacterales bacterium]
MRRSLIAVLISALAGTAVAATVPRRIVQRRRAPLVQLKTIQPDIKCPAVLGVGVKTGEQFCDVLAGQDPLTGILITIPRHRGMATLTFDLHNRETYSPSQVRAHRAYARYTATVDVLALDGTLIDRGVIRSSFRTAADLVDRISGGAGPGGVKAVAPTGTQPIRIAIPEKIDQVSILGEKVDVVRLDGSYTYNAPGRPIADISNVRVEYRPAPPLRPRRPVRRDVRRRP